MSKAQQYSPEWFTHEIDVGQHWLMREDTTCFKPMSTTMLERWEIMEQISAMDTMIRNLHGYRDTLADLLRTHDGD
jgi:hypothetical protein